MFLLGATESVVFKIVDVLKQPASTSSSTPVLLLSHPYFVL